MRPLVAVSGAAFAHAFAFAFAFAFTFTVASCTGAEREVTWADVQPLLAASCLECHRDGDERRPSFATYADASALAPELLFAIESGRMPPGGIDRSGACGTFVGPRPPSSDDVALLRAWVDVGAPEGAPSRGARSPSAPPVAPSVAPPVAPLEEGTRVVTSTLPLAATGAADVDTQRCTVVDLGAPAFLVGVHMRAPPAAHHAMIFTIADSAVFDDAVDDGDDGDDGDRAPAAESWPCASVPRASSGESGSLAFAWVPGRDDVRLPEHTGVPLTSRVIVQLHEHGVVDEGAAATLSIQLRADVTRALAVVPVAMAGFTLPPGAPVELVRDVELPEGDVVGVMPHLHAAGRSLTLEVAGDACVVSAPRYDFAFQEVAFFERPLAIGPRAQGTLTCAWDTSERAAPTHWGEGSLDEMCTVFLFTTPG